MSESVHDDAFALEIAHVFRLSGQLDGHLVGFPDVVPGSPHLAKRARPEPLLQDVFADPDAGLGNISILLFGSLFVRSSAEAASLISIWLVLVNLFSSFVLRLVTIIKSGIISSPVL